MINRIKIKHLAASRRFLPKKHEYKAERAGQDFFPDWLNKGEILSRCLFNIFDAFRI
jgi:hypothetical protein